MPESHHRIADPHRCRYHRRYHHGGAEAIQAGAAAIARYSLAHHDIGDEQPTVDEREGETERLTAEAYGIVSDAVAVAFGLAGCVFLVLAANAQSKIRAVLRLPK